MSVQYPAKILLFGEHTVLRGGRGLAVPYPAMSLSWQREQPDERLLKFCDYLKVAIPSDLLAAGRLEDDLLDDWCLKGNIPTGYGLGSSGAVCAATWDKYATQKGKTLDDRRLIKVLARMEQHFHGQSSGTDPLIAYRQQAMLLGGAGGPEAVRLTPGWSRDFFLLDTGQERQASQLIRTFLQEYDTGDREGIEQGWLLPADRAISALIAGDRAAVFAATRKLSAYQLAAFPSFIPKAYHAAWDGGDRYALKICGAGGGGMLLGIANDRKAARDVFGKKLYWL